MNIQNLTQCVFYRKTTPLMLNHTIASLVSILFLTQLGFAQDTTELSPKQIERNRRKAIAKVVDQCFDDDAAYRSKKEFPHYGYLQAICSAENARVLYEILDVKPDGKKPLPYVSVRDDNFYTEDGKTTWHGYRLTFTSSRVGWGHDIDFLECKRAIGYSQKIVKKVGMKPEVELPYNEQLFSCEINSYNAMRPFITSF